MYEDTMQTERAGMNEAGNRKAKRWGFVGTRIGELSRARQSNWLHWLVAQDSQIEPVETNTSRPLVQACAGGSPKSHTARQSGSLSRANPFSQFQAASCARLHSESPKSHTDGQSGSLSRANSFRLVQPS